jgi:hypothetical protein
MEPNKWYYSEQLQYNGVGERNAAPRLSELVDDGMVVARNSPERGKGKHKQYMMAPPKAMSAEYLAILTPHPFLGCPKCKGPIYEIAMPKKDLYCKPCNFLLSSKEEPSNPQPM